MDRRACVWQAIGCSSFCFEHNEDLLAILSTHETGVDFDIPIVVSECHRSRWVWLELELKGSKQFPVQKRIIEVVE